MNQKHEYYEEFFQSFNIEMQSGYNAYITITEKRKGDRYVSNKECELQECLDKAYRKWMSMQLVNIGQTPSEYLETTEFNEIKDMFSIGAEICDDDFPEVYIEKLLSYGNEAMDFLIEIINSKAAVASIDELIQPVQAIKLLGRFKAEGVVIPLINAIEHSASELIQETARDALVNIGPAAVDGILIELNVRNRSDEAWENIVMSLAKIGRDCPSDEIFSVLKKAFYELTDKVVIASCLAEYGDGRAIPTLRGFLLKNGEDMGRGAFYDIVGSVRQLGGRIDDLKQVPKKSE